MGRYVFRLPDVGEGIAEVELVKWHAAAGDSVKEGQPLADIMTDKATVEISAPVSGTLSGIFGKEGGKLAVGSDLAVFETDREVQEERPAPSSATADEPRLDVETARPRASGKALAAPAVRARARALKIDLSSLAGTGPEGRVTHADLDGLLTRKAPDAPALQPLPAGEEAEDIPVFGLRRRIAERMLESKRRIPHFTYVEEIDGEALEELRSRLNGSRTGDRLTILPFVIRAVVKALESHPAVNSHYDETAGVIRRFRPVHVGIATQTDRGLLVPVIRNAQSLTPDGLAAAILRLSGEARAGKSDRNELSGSTITVTSLGALGGIMATPIINPPEVAVIGINRMMERACVRDGRISARRVMNLSSSFDHRVIDGYEAASFIAVVKGALESPEQLAT